MFYNINMKNEIQDNQLKIHILFKEIIENKEESFIVSASATVAYFLQKKNIQLYIKDKKIYAKEDCICEITIHDKSIEGIFYIDQIKKIDNKAKAMTMIPGLKAYYNIYFNLYQNKEYYKIKDYYQTIKK